MPTFNIMVLHIAERFEEVNAKHWVDAVSIAEERAREAGLHTTGTCRVYDENHQPVDTTK